MRQLTLLRLEEDGVEGRSVRCELGEECAALGVHRPGERTVDQRLLSWRQQQLRPCTLFEVRSSCSMMVTSASERVVLGPGSHGENDCVAWLAADPVHARMVRVGVRVAADRAPLGRRAVVAPVLRRLWVALVRTLFVREPRSGSKDGEKESQRWPVHSPGCSRSRRRWLRQAAARRPPSSGR